MPTFGRIIGMVADNKESRTPDLIIDNQVLIHRPAAAVNETSTVKGFQRVDAPIEDENRSEKDDVIDLSFKWAGKRSIFGPIN